MEEKNETTHIPHDNKNIAYHMEWGFRQEAAVWKENIPIVPNFYPLATDLVNWMLRQGDLMFLPSINNKSTIKYTNPYTNDGAILSIIFARIINDSANFVHNNVDIDPVQAEIKHIRLYTEQVLYIARLCEAFIKQLLFCTTFSEGDYRGSALGSLLSKNCNGCFSSKEKRHKISLLGSLAHRYDLCNLYEDCLNEHMKIVNRRRDVEAAHSGVIGFKDHTVLAIREQFGKEISDIGDNFVHMLGHISDIEIRMLRELRPLIEVEAQKASPVISNSRKDTTGMV